MYDNIDSSNSTCSIMSTGSKNISGTNNNNNNNNWILLDQEEGSGDTMLRGVTIQVEESSGTIVSVSTRTCPDQDRWRSLSMPLFLQNHQDMDANTTSYDFSTTQLLDLHNSRYIHNLQPTIHLQFPNLRQLLLTRCDRLQILPDSIGSLHFLQEVRWRHDIHVIAAFVYSWTCLSCLTQRLALFDVSWLG